MPWLFCLIAFSFRIGSLEGFAATSSTAERRQFIEITNPLRADVVTERLPVSFVSDWPTWVLMDDSSRELFKIPALGDDDGYVDPTSVDELWQPMDLKQPQCRLAVGLHVRNGVVRHVLPAVDLSLNGQHRNRGMCSVPRAYCWMDFPSIMAGGPLSACRMVLETRGGTNDDGGEEWRTLIEVESIEREVNHALRTIADQPPTELGEGSNIVHAVCTGTAPVECPKPGCELRALLLADDGVVGALQVKVEKTAAGSDSDYLPKAYEKLFGDRSLKRPAFLEMKKRMEKKNRNSS